MIKKIYSVFSKKYLFKKYGLAVKGQNKKRQKIDILYFSCCKTFPEKYDIDVYSSEIENKKVNLVIFS